MARRKLPQLFCPWCDNVPEEGARVLSPLAWSAHQHSPWDFTPSLEIVPGKRLQARCSACPYGEIYTAKDVARLACVYARRLGRTEG